MRLVSERGITSRDRRARLKSGCWETLGKVNFMPYMTFTHFSPTKNHDRRNVALSCATMFGAGYNPPVARLNNREVLSAVARREAYSVATISSARYNPLVERRTNRE